MLAYLDYDTPFPQVDKALKEPNGLLAAGGDLSVERLLTAYSHGIFPWYSHEEPILWWSPDPRTVFFIDSFKIRKSVKKALRSEKFSVTLNHNFASVIENCAQCRGDGHGTWITPEMKRAYLDLHQLNKAHSMEVWSNDELIGGIYGVAIGHVFCGESMFSRVSNGSKIALTCLAHFLKKSHFKLIDCQVENPHLSSLGASNISREIYLEILTKGQIKPQNQINWEPQLINWQELLDLLPDRPTSEIHHNDKTS